MATAKSKDEWSRTSHLMVMLFNVNGGTPAKTDWQEYNPHIETVEQKKAPITELTKWAK